MAAILMTKSVWGSADNGAMEPPQSMRLMSPFSRPAQLLSVQGYWANGVAQVQGAWPYKNTGEGLFPDIDYTGSVPPQYCL